MLENQAARELEEDLLPLIPNGFAMGLGDHSSLRSFVLHPLEEALLSPRAKSKKRKEFIMGRAAAHAALRNMGATARAVGKGKFGEPAWPEGTIGSISHKDDLALAIVGSKDKCRAIGVDLETIWDPIAPQIANRICHQSEIPWVFEVSCLSALRMKMIFSAKESIFKALNPLNGVFINFKEIQLRWLEGEKGFVFVLPERMAPHPGDSRSSHVYCIITSHYVSTFFIVW